MNDFRVGTNTLPIESHTSHAPVSRLAASEKGQQALERVIGDVRPQVRQRLKQKGITGEDLDDLCEEALQRFTLALQRREAREQGALDHPERYALSVAETVFDDHLRRIRPNWCRLKRRVLYLLDNTATKGLFARWKNRSAWVGGFLRWNAHPFRPNARYHVLCSRPGVFCRQELQDQTPEQLPLPSLMAHLFRWLGTPLEVDELTTQIARLQNVQDTAALSIEELAQQQDREAESLLPPSSEDVETRVLDAMQGEDFRAGLYQIISALPARQRTALLLGMSADEMLLIAPMSQLADTLETGLDELLGLWSALPLMDGQIAQRLDITPKQVSNLRKCARERIARWMTKQQNANDESV